MSRLVAGLPLALLLVLIGGAPGSAQTLGTFRWQLQPYCNVVTVTVVQQGDQFQIDGTDDLCGAAAMASVVGRAFFNPNGTIGFGLTTVTTTNAVGIHLDARISLATLGGPWRDSAGNSGQFVLTPAAGTGGSPRPIPPNGIGAGSITSFHLAAGSVTSEQIAGGAISATQIAPGSITGAQIAPGSISGSLIAPGSIGNTQLVPGLIASATAAFGACPVGQYLRGVLANGTLLCEPFAVPPVLTPVQSANHTGQESSIAIGADGLAIVSHWDDTANDLVVTHCNNASCTEFVSTSVDSTGSVGRYTSIAIGTDGLAVVSHRDIGNNFLRVTHCSNLSCTAATSLDVDTSGPVGMHTSIAIGSDGFPVITHRNSTTNELRVTHCTTVDCSTATSLSVGVAGSLGWNTAVVIGTDGMPMIAHRDGGSGDLRVTHCTTLTCSTATSTVVDTVNDAGFDVDIAIGSDGLPVVSHWDNTVFDLRVTHCSNVACTAATSTAAATVGDVGQYTSIAIGTDGYPVISHWAGGSVGDLQVTHCDNVTCTAATTTKVDTSNAVGLFTSLAVGTDGFPLISSFDSTNSNLRMAKCHTRTCR